MKTLLFRTPVKPRTLVAGCQLALPLSHKLLSRAVRTGNVRVDGKVMKTPDATIPGGSRVEWQVRGASTPARVKSISIVARGADWVVLNKPAGVPCHAPADGVVDAIALAAACLSCSRDTLWPAHRLDAAVGGLWLVALSREAAARLSAAFEARQVTKTYRAIAPVLPWTEGRFEGKLNRKKAHTLYRVGERRGSVAEVELSPVTGRTHQLRRHLADAGFPMVGDTTYGGVVDGGGLRLQSCGLTLEQASIDVALPRPENWWPRMPVFDVGAQRPALVVSRATIKAMRRGHPWVLTDTETRGAGRVPPGSVADVMTADGKGAGQVVIEGLGRVAARRWWDKASKPMTVEARTNAALRRRAALHGDADTDHYRLVHGEADQLPGLIVDRCGQHLRLLVTGHAALGYAGQVAERVARTMEATVGAPFSAVQVNHLPSAPAGRHIAVTPLFGSPPDGRSIARERGCLYHVELGLEEPDRPRPGIGLFIDQRANRDRMIEVCRGGTWLNLFAHTGAFSVAALRHGAKEVVSVDLSGRYLNWLDENLALNELQDAAHTCVKRDVRRYLAQLPPDTTFDGIILDPPTAAAAGRKFWSIRKEGAALIAECLRRLNPGGHLLACRNDRRGRGNLEALVRSTAQDAGVRLAAIEAAPAGPDFPSLSGFPDGDPFEALWIRRKN